MRLYDPTSSGPQRTLHRAAAIANLDGRTMGVLENGKLNAVEMLRELAALFEAHHGCTLRAVYSKSNPSAPALAGVLAQAAAEVDFLITGSAIEALARRAVCMTASALNSSVNGRWFCAPNRSR